MNDKDMTEKKDPWEGHRVSRPIPIDEEKKHKEAQEKAKQPSLFSMFGNDQEETEEVISKENEE